MQKSTSKYVLALLFLAVLLTYTNCANDGKLSIKDLASLSNEQVEPPLISSTPVPPPLPPDPPPLSPPAPNPFLANEFGGSGAMINSGTAGQIVLFQNANNSKLINRDGGATQQSGINNGYGMGAFIDPKDQNKTKFFIVDRNNHRILIFNQVPTSIGSVPDVVVGQTAFTGGLINAGQAAVNSRGFAGPTYVSVCGDGKMLVADQANNRVLIYNQIPRVSGAVADIVVGQPGLTSNLAGAGATGLVTPYAAYCFDRKLFIIDRGNQRIVVHNIFPTINNSAANFVIGQPDFITVTAGCAANKLNIAYEIVRYKNELYVADGFNHRVLRFATVPTAFGAVATNVIGQPNLTTCLPNRGLPAAAANTLNTPTSVAVGKDTLAVADFANNRILFYSLPVLAINLNAKGLLGQPDFITNLNYASVNAMTVNRAKGLIFDGNYIWMNLSTDNRVINMLLPFVL
ncbi:MAG: hypothetical protein SGJ18_07495 [Pseudomonadota bacterium]|nr:hypothetical protein [Pseudomonadota bacterium]